MNVFEHTHERFLEKWNHNYGDGQKLVRPLLGAGVESKDLAESIAFLRSKRGEKDEHSE